MVWVKFPVARSDTSPAEVPAAVKISVDETGKTIFDYSPLHAWAAQHASKIDAVDNLVEQSASIVIWTTTPWTLPGNRAVSFSSKVTYGLYEVTAAPEGNWARQGDKLNWPTSSRKLFEGGKGRSLREAADSRAEILRFGIVCASTARQGLRFRRPLLDGDHVTDGTAPALSTPRRATAATTFEIWMANTAKLIGAASARTSPSPSTPTASSPATPPASRAQRVLKENGDKGDANDASSRRCRTPMR